MMSRVGQMHWYSFRHHTSHAVCFGFAQGPWLFSNMASDWLVGGRFTAAEVFHQPDLPVEWKIMYYSNNRNAYNQVTQITDLNFNWGMLGVSSYL